MHLPVVKRNLRTNSGALCMAFIDLAVRQGVFWGVAMAFVLGLSKEDIVLPAAFFGVGMGAFSAPWFMTVKVSTAIDSNERAAVEERIRHVLVSDDYRLQETGDGYARFDPTSGFKDWSIGPIRLVPDSSIVMLCDSDTLLLAGPFAGVQHLAKRLNESVASATSPPTTPVHPVEHSAPLEGHAPVTVEPGVAHQPMPEASIRRKLTAQEPS